MAIKVDIIDQTAVVSINDLDLATFCCVHMANAMAQQLQNIRNLPYREAMHHCLMHLGCCEKTAQVIIAELHSELKEERTTLQ